MTDPLLAEELAQACFMLREAGLMRAAAMLAKVQATEIVEARPRRKRMTEVRLGADGKGGKAWIDAQLLVERVVTKPAVYYDCGGAAIVQVEEHYAIQGQESGTVRGCAYRTWCA